MLGILGFFIAGFFFPVWPWGVAVAAILPVFHLFSAAQRHGRTRHEARSPGAGVKLLVWPWLVSFVMNGCLMALGNWVGRWF